MAKEYTYVKDGNPVNYTYTGPFSEHLDIASFYGFSPVPPTADSDEAHKHARKVLDVSRLPKLDPKNPNLCISERITLLNKHNTESMHRQPQPIKFAFGKKGEGKNPGFLNLSVFGSPSSIIDNLVIHQSLVLLREQGHKNLYLEINSVGDKDSRQAFFRDLVAFYRKNLNDMPADARQAFKSSPESLLRFEDDFMKELNETAPQSVSYLNDDSSDRFKEIIEFLDYEGIPYRINNRLVANKNSFSESIFEIYSLPEGDGLPEICDSCKLLATGGRSNHLSYKVGVRRDIPFLHASVKIDKASGKESYKVSKASRTQPMAFFVQIGNEAKIQSFALLEEIRKAELPVSQCVSREKLSIQLSAAEKVAAPYTLIVGQVEARERTIIVRRMSDRSQETIPQEKLVSYLKKINKKKL